MTIYCKFFNLLTVGDIEGKTKMAFAKMQTPQSLRDTYMLTDTDFESIRDSEDTSLEPEMDADEVFFKSFSFFKG